MIKEEWKRLAHNPLLIVVIAAIVLIPSIYAGFFLASMWDPYGELDKLPVAVVNLDSGSEYNGSELHIGDDLVENLEEDASLDFRFVDPEEAEKGLRDGKYYMVVTIPEDFSYRASTATDADPEKMELLYETNPATNYIAMKLSESAMTKIEMSLEQKVSETYIETIFDRFGTISDGMYDAANGEDELLEGEGLLTDGASELNDGASALNSGASDLKDGTDSLLSGASDLGNGISGYLNGASEINGGIQDLDSALVTINSGAEDLNNGSVSLAEGTSELDSAASDLASGAQSVSAATEQLSSGAEDLASGASDLASGASSLSGGLETLNGSIPALTEGIGTLNAGAGDLRDGIAAYTAGVGSAYEGSSSVTSGLNDLCSASGELASGADDLGNAIEQINGYASAMAATGDENWIQLSQYTEGLLTGYGQINAGISSVNDNLSLLADGSAQVTDGLGTLNDNSATLCEGSEQLAAGASALNDSAPALSGALDAAVNGADAVAQGANSLSAGANDLADGAGTVAQGAQTLYSGTEAVAEGIGQVDQGAQALAAGTGALYAGTSQAENGASQLLQGSNTLVGNNEAISNGVQSLTQGADSLATGAGDMLNGTQSLSDGTDELLGSLTALSDGTTEIRDGLSEGADEISSSNMEETNAEMISDPVETTESRMTEVSDNGHAMAAYMMSVGLWVASLAFCLMYPLTEHGKLTGGFSWWFSKASILYPMAILQAILLVLILHIRLGFDPTRFAGTVAIACLASVAFMSVMYFFNVLLGKVGSFLMLIFMVLQLAGSAGTYPLEISGPLAQGLNRFMPFTYTVKAFRSTIGGGERCTDAVIVLTMLFLVSTLLTILLFVIRGKKELEGKKDLHYFMEERGLA